MNISVDGYELVIREPLERCRSCRKLMLRWYRNIPLTDRRAIESAVARESYRDSGICTNCIKSGGFPRKCVICAKNKEFPKEFAYALTRYAKYPEAETEYDYVCNECVQVRCVQLVVLMAEADEVDKVK